MLVTVLHWKINFILVNMIYTEGEKAISQTIQKSDDFTYFFYIVLYINTSIKC